MKHPEHICRFNDDPQSCDCYDKGFEMGKEKIICLKCKEEKIRYWCVECVNETLNEANEEAFSQLLAKVKIEEKKIRQDERQAWINHERCRSCGNPMKPSEFTDTCLDCFENE